GLSTAGPSQDWVDRKAPGRDAQKNAAPIAVDDAYSVPENGVLRVERQVITPVAVRAEVNQATAQKTLDGDAWTYWNAAGENPAISCDWGGVRRAFGIGQTPGGFPGTPFPLPASVDTLAFRPVTQGTLPSRVFGETLFARRDVRYLQLRIRRTDREGFGEL